MSEERVPFSEEDIEFLLANVKMPRCVSREIADVLTHAHRKQLAAQLRKMTGYRSALQEYRDCIERAFYKSLAPAGDPAGILAAQSMESFTQMTLNMFHSAGTGEKDVSSGLVRFEELINGSKFPKKVAYSLKPLPGATVKPLRRTSIEDFVVSTAQVEHGTRVEWNYDALVAAKTTPFDVALRVETPQCRYSARTGVFVHLEGDPPALAGKWGGVDGVTSEAVLEDGTIEGNGGTMLGLMTHPGVDPTTVIVDKAHDILAVLGVEATVAFLVQEFHRIMSLDGSNIHRAHARLLVDRMLIDGTITPVTRHGMKSKMFQPLARGSFEENLLNLYASAANAEVDHITSVNARVITGKPPLVGTGYANVLMK